MSRYLILLSLLVWSLNADAQVEVFRNTEDTSTYIAPEDTITKPPQYGTGEFDFFDYIEKHYILRNTAQSLDLNGAVVKFSFYINKDGTISDYEHLYSNNVIVATEIQRVISRMPKWSPGYEAGKKKRTLMIYELNVRIMRDNIPPIEITKNSGSLEYTSKTNPLKWFIVSGTLLILLTLWITR